MNDTTQTHMSKSGIWNWKLEVESGSGSGTFYVEAEARIYHRFRFHIGGKIGERKEIGSAVYRRRMNGGSINIKKCERGGAV